MIQVVRYVCIAIAVFVLGSVAINSFSFYMNKRSNAAQGLSPQAVQSLILTQAGKSATDVPRPASLDPRRLTFDQKKKHRALKEKFLRESQDLFGLKHSAAGFATSCVESDGHENIGKFAYVEDRDVFTKCACIAYHLRLQGIDDLRDWRLVFAFKENPSEIREYAEAHQFDDRAIRRAQQVYMSSENKCSQASAYEARNIRKPRS